MYVFCWSCCLFWQRVRKTDLWIAESLWHDSIIFVVRVFFNGLLFRRLTLCLLDNILHHKISPVLVRTVIFRILRRVRFLQGLLSNFPKSLKTLSHSGLRSSKSYASVSGQRVYDLKFIDKTSLLAYNCLSWELTAFLITIRIDVIESCVILNVNLSLIQSLNHRCKKRIFRFFYYFFLIFWKVFYFLVAIFLWC